MKNEQLSVWMDGEAAEREGAIVLRELGSDARLRQECELFWLIGDALRNPEPGAALGVSLTDKVMAALEAEPTVLAPRSSAPQQARGLADRWLPAAAAVAGVAVAAWMSLSLLAPATQLAPAVAVAAPPAGDPKPVQQVVGGEQAYYLAHQASTIGAPIGGVAQYIRMVGDEQAGTR